MIEGDWRATLPTQRSYEGHGLYDDVTRSCQRHCRSTPVTWLTEVLASNSHLCHTRYQSRWLELACFTSQSHPQPYSLDSRRRRRLHSSITCLRRRQHPSTLSPTPSIFRQAARRRVEAPVTAAAAVRGRSACRCRQRRHGGCASSSRSRRRTTSIG